jgi:KaiC/GvpD/RAD55 family RecA-like ATPase
LERAREAVQRLSPDRLCLGGLLDLRGAAPDVVRGVIGAVVDALLGGGLVRVVSAVIETLTRRSLRQLLMKWGIVRNETVECLKNIVNTAKEASQYIDDEGLRDVVEEVARKWGWDVDTFKHFIKTAAGKTVTESEVEKMIEEALEKIEEELGKVRERVSGWLAGVEVFFINDFEDGSAYPTVRLVNGELMVLGEYGYHEVVRTGSFSTLTNEVKQRLGAGSLVVLTGPKGVGKSTLATVTIWELLRGGEVGMVLRIRELPDGEVVERFRSFIENFLVRDWEYFGNLIILYDPTGVYGQVGGVEAPSKLETIVRNVFEAVRRAVENARSIGKELTARVGVLIILPTDLYNALGNDVRGKLESYRLDAPLNDVEFLAGLIREYTRTSDKPSGCKISDEELSKLAGELAKFDSGHALIARLIGEELARNNCNVGEVKELINNAKGKAEKFITQYINKLFKVDENPDTAEALVEIFALRKPFVNSTRPGDPILTPGIVELIGEEGRAKLLYSAVGEELRGWLARRQHDLIEDSIGELLRCIANEGEECKELGDALKPWKTIGVMETLRDVSEKVSNVDSAVEYFASNYGEKLTNTLKLFSNCWKRAVFIIGAALAGHVSVPRLKNLSVFLPENLRNLSKSDIEFLGYALSRLGVDVDKIPSLIMNLSKYSASVVEFLGDALKECGVDYYLFVGDEIPPLIRYLTKDYAYALAEAFIDRYNEVVAEVRRALNIIKNRSDLYNDEVLYSLGLALIIAKAVESGKPIEPSDADATLHIASSAMQHVISFTSLSLIKPVLSALVPLRDKAPQRYLEVLASALGKVSAPDILGFMCPDLDTVMYILNEFDYILNKYGDGVKGHAWTLVHAINASINSLYKCLKHCDDYTFEYMNMDAFFRTKLEHVVSRVAGLLNEINKLNPSLGIIAWAYALNPALDNKCVRALMESVLGIDVVNKAKEVAGELSKLRVQELIRNKDFMGFVESWLAETDEKAARREILEETSNLKYALAQYKLDNDELKEAEELFNGAARERREIGDYQNYLDNSNWALRAKAIRDPLAGEDLVKLVNGFRQLYEEAKKQPGTLLLSNILGGYLVSLALTGGDEEIRRIEELLEEQWRGPGGYLLTPILTRLTLNVLLSPRGELSGELKDRLFVKPGELIVALGGGYIDINSLPALRAIYGTIKPGDEKRLCDESIDDPIIHVLCMHLVSRVIDYSKELDQRGEGNLRQGLINVFQWWISKGEVLDLLKKLGLDAESLVNEFRGLIHELSVKSLPALASFSHCFEHEQRYCSSAHLTYMLYALINGNEKLAKAHALYGAVSVAGKLPARLFLEAYRACCDLGSEEFRRAIAKLFFYHV